MKRIVLLLSPLVILLSPIIDAFQGVYIDPRSDAGYAVIACVAIIGLALGMKGIRAGIVWVNTYRAVSPVAPFGGFGLSGHGREGGLEAALDYTRSKTVWLRTSDDPIPDPFVMR